MNIQVFSVPKYPPANEDCWRVGECSAVLCDGASESFASGTWARILADSPGVGEKFGDAWLAERIGEYEREIDPSSLGWAKTASYERGSFATFLSVEIKGLTCHVNAIGDTVAFSVNRDRIIDSYPYCSEAEFLKKPYLLSTRRDLNRSLETWEGESSGGSRRIDITSASHVILMTDALAHWMMKGRPQEVRDVLKIDSDAAFAELVERERRARRLRFDDTTMIRIDLPLALEENRRVPMFPAMDV